MKDVIKKLSRFAYRPRRDDTPRPNIERPWRAAGSWYATNGKWLVRVPVEDGDPPAPDLGGMTPPDAPELLKLYGFDNLPVITRLNRRALSTMLSRVSLTALEEDNNKTLLGFAPGRVAMFAGNSEQGWSRDCWIAPEDTRPALAAVNGQYLKKLLTGWWTPRDTVVVKVKRDQDGTILQFSNPRTGVEVILVGLLERVIPIDYTPVKAALEGVPEEDARPVVKAAKAVKRSKPRKAAKPALDKETKTRVETRKGGKMKTQEKPKDTNKAPETARPQGVTLGKWDLVEYTSRRGNTARYWVVWTGKNSKGVDRVKLVRKGGHPFFVDAARVRLVEKAQDRKRGVA